MPGPVVPLGLLSKTSKVGKALASAAKPVTDSICTSESLLSKRIEAIERLGDLQFIINGYIVTGETDEDAVEVFDDLKRHYLQSRSFFNKKVSHLLSKYMTICKNAYVGKGKVDERELETIMENLEFEFRCSVNPLPTHIWLRLLRHKLAPIAILVVLILIFLLFKKGIRLLLE
jgi:hypothetical protein